MGDYLARRDLLRPLLKQVLDEQLIYRDQIAELLTHGTTLSVDDLIGPVNTEDLLLTLDGIDVREFGQHAIGEALAELGKLPMYGLPTRARQLYTGFSGEARNSAITPESMDRDLELAIHEFQPGSVLVRDKREHQAVGLSGSFMSPFNIYRNGGNYDPGDAFSREFALMQCPGCGGWHRVSDPIQDGTCEGCGGILQASSARQCLVPVGFRTDFQPSSEKERTARGGVRISMAETRPLALVGINDSNCSFVAVAEQQLYRLNRGSWEDDANGGRWSGFTFARGRSRVSPEQGHNFSIANQWIDTRFDANTPDFRRNGPEKVGVFLAAPKVTGAIFVAPKSVPPWISLKIRSNGQYQGSGRAAMISAAFLLVFRAAQELDVDPEDFEVIEPRPYAVNGEFVPVMQLCDSLVNGSGLCDRLAGITSDQPLLLDLILSIIKDVSAFPMSDFLAGTHAAVCEHACYEFLQRYGNQSYHGLLDWRLALDYLALLADQTFRMHLPKAPPTPWTHSWLEQREQLVNVMLRMIPNPERREIGGLPVIRVGPGDEWAAIVHPLWNWDHLIGIYGDLANFADTHNVAPVSTFDLARRPARTLDDVRKTLVG